MIFLESGYFLLGSDMLKALRISELPILLNIVSITIGIACLIIGFGFPGLILLREKYQKSLKQEKRIQQYVVINSEILKCKY